MHFESRPIAAGVRHIFSRVDPWTLCILACGTALAAHAAWRLSVTHDESAHVPAGLAYWQFGAFDIYPHNPPLVKMCLALPLLASGARVDRGWLLRHAGPRYEWLLGQEFLREHYGDAQSVYFRARLLSVAFFAWGGWMVGAWSRELFGVAAGRIAAALWCSQPLVIAHASLATPDVGAAVLGLAAARAMARYANAPNGGTATWAGIALGLAQLAKYTLLVLYVVWFVLAILGLRTGFRGAAVVRWQRLAWLFYVPLVSLFVTCAGYGFSGVAEPIGARTFFSRRFREVTSWLPRAFSSGANRLPVPLPRDYLEGLDRQWADVEHGWPSYLHGKVRTCGWWYYYPVALAMKTPISFWLLAAMATLAAAHGARTSGPSEAALFITPLLVAGLLEANTSLAFLRYFLPALPFLCVSVSRVAAGRRWSSDRRWRLATVLLAVITGALPISRHPEYLGYFNLASGGPAGAWKWFADGDIDWGQDLGALARWQHHHPQARPMRLTLFSPFSPPYPGLIDDTPDVSDEYTFWIHMTAIPRIPVGPSVGYLAVSVSVLNRMAAEGVPQASSRERQFCRWLKNRAPLALVGSSILIFHFSADDVRDWSKQSPK